MVVQTASEQKHGQMRSLQKMLAGKKSISINP
jgi:hypothetical protein